MMWAADPSGTAHQVFFTAANGKQYCTGSNACSSTIYVRDGDVYKPFAATIAIYRNSDYYRAMVAAVGQTVTQFPIMADPAKYPEGNYFWQDRNNDQTIQEDELTPMPKSIGMGVIGAVDPHMGMYVGNALLQPVRYDAEGKPVYDVTKITQLAPYNSIGQGVGWLDPDNNAAYTYNIFLPSKNYFAKWAPDGKLLWAYPDMIEWKRVLDKPMQAPGRLYGMTMPLGVAGNFTGMSDYFGTYHIFTTDGVYVGMLMRDGRDGKGFGPDLTASETLTGQLVKPDGMNRYFLLAGASDARVTEIFGLDTVKSLPGGTIDLKDDDTKTAAAALADYNAKISSGKSLSIARGVAGLETAEPVTKTLDDTRAFSAKAAYDPQNLYVSFDVTSPFDLINTEPDPMVPLQGRQLPGYPARHRPICRRRSHDGGPQETFRILVTRQVPPTGGAPVPLCGHL